MVNRDDRFDVVGDELVDQVIVEIDAFRIDCAPAIRQHSGPSDRKAVSGQAQLLHELYILLPAMIVVAGHRAIIAVLYIPFNGTEGVPNTSRTAIFVTTFYLVRSCRTAPQETLWKFQCHGLGLSTLLAVGALR